jgi:hypothetical protein
MAITGAMVAAQAIPEIFKLITSAKQKKMANEFGKAQRPGYEIPQAYKDYLAQTKFNASVSGLPGQAQLENKLQRQQASTVARSIQSQGSAAERNMAAAAGDFATKQTLEDTAYDAARFKAARQQEYNTAQQVMAKQQLAQWDWDKKQRYLDFMGAQAAGTESANKNAMTALEGLTGAFQTAGAAGLFGTGDRAAGGGTAAAPGTTTAPATTAATPAAATPAVSNAMNFGATSAFNQYFGDPNNATEYNQIMVPGNDLANANYGFADPNSNRYTYSNVNDGYDVTDMNTNKTTFVNPTNNAKAFGAITDIDPFISSIMQPRVAGSDMAFPDMQLRPNTPMPRMTGGMNDYGPEAQRAIRRAGGGEVSEFNVNLPGDITNNWANNYFGMEMPTAYGYGNTFNEIMNRIGTQYGLGDVYGEDLSNNINRAYSRFNPFG